MTWPTDVMVSACAAIRAAQAAQRAAPDDASPAAIVQGMRLTRCLRLATAAETILEELAESAAALERANRREGRHESAELH